MPFSFSFSSSATFTTTTSSSANGEPRGWGYRHESYSTPQGSGVRTTRQQLGQAPVVRTRMYDANGRPMLVDSEQRRRDNNNNARIASGQGRIISIEDVTEEEDAKAQARQQQQQQQQQQSQTGN